MWRQYVRPGRVCWQPESRGRFMYVSLDTLSSHPSYPNPAISLSLFFTPIIILLYSSYNPPLSFFPATLLFPLVPLIFPLIFNCYSPQSLSSHYNLPLSSLPLPFPIIILRATWPLTCHHQISIITFKIHL